MDDTDVPGLDQSEALIRCGFSAFFGDDVMELTKRHERDSNLFSYSFQVNAPLLFEKIRQQRRRVQDDGSNGTKIRLRPCVHARAPGAGSPKDLSWTTPYSSRTRALP